MKKFVIVLIIMLLPGIAFAGSSGDHKILKVGVTDTLFYIFSSDGDFNSATCTDNGSSTLTTVNNVIAFNKTDFPNGYSHLLSIALAAYIGGKKISIWYSGCQNSPWNNGKMPKPVSIEVKD